MRPRPIILVLVLIASVSLLAMSLLPKYSAQIFLGRLISEAGAHSLTTKTYGTHARHKLDIYKPTSKEGVNEAGNRDPIILFLYGGGWRDGTRKMYQFVGSAFARRGFTTIIPDYRTYPEVSFPDFIEDAALAYHWVWKNIAAGGATSGTESGASTRPIIIMGHSAGAHSAAMIALNPDYIARHDASTPRPAALIGVSGPYAFDATTWPTTKDIFSTAPNADTARPSAHVDGSAPPALLLYGLKDTTVRLFNMETMAENYKKAGRSVQTKTYPNLKHIDIILTIARPLRWRATVFDDITRFIKNYNKPAQ